MIFSLGHLLLLLVVLMFFGPRFLPGAGRVLGRTARAFREGRGEEGPHGGVVDVEYRRLDRDEGPRNF